MILIPIPILLERYIGMADFKQVQYKIEPPGISVTVYIKTDDFDFPVVSSYIFTK